MSQPSIVQTIAGNARYPFLVIVYIPTGKRTLEAPMHEEISLEKTEQGTELFELFHASNVQL